MITSDRMAQVDANAAALGVPRAKLMESSGAAVARAVRAESEPGDRVVVVAGRGNNGGDGLVAARFLDDRRVSVRLLGRRETIATETARENFEALRRAEYDAREVRDTAALDLPETDVVVDAMLGTGLGGPPREPEATVVERVNDADATVVAVDVPSGVDADTGETPGVAVDADRVVTFHDRAPGLTGLDAAVTVADIGIPDAAERFVERGDLLALSRDPTAHKGQHGEVLVVGGGPYTGAPALAARAALRAGADLVRVACPASVAREVQATDPALVVRELDGDRLAPAHVDRLLDLAAEHDAVVVGPGLGDADPTLDAVVDLLSGHDGRVVVDADALRAVPHVDADADLTCTPHRGELRRMGGPDLRERPDPEAAVAAFAAEVGATLLVKGARDVVSDGEDTRVNRTGNPGMTVGGTGDVLAGLTGALAGSLSPVQAAAVAAYANGRAGDLAVNARETDNDDVANGDDMADGDHVADDGRPPVGGYGLLPTDLVERLPRALWGDRP
ncbi:bifunctional ADP-dependent NAD(P)H-hydrate dehydratase/NAD(P)H-hydrate epimerase [Halobacteriales archaeon SW_12_71_31]|nr:MAG: bifunctional ADP-dependent NAD(P)H-hydrate dehydratase/NAD(P)H-hydrate epimerase [Halobacteriales archaeon SW_12_71_31]